MAFVCPKCHETLDDEAICCADIQFTWKCRTCGKRSMGFAFPFGRCQLCGGHLKRVETTGAGGQEFSPAAVEALQVALQFEISAETFYRLAAERSEDPDAQRFFREMADFEHGHRVSLEEKYHMHRKDAETPVADDLLQRVLFAGVDDGHPLYQAADIYELAILMEKRTRDFFQQRVQELRGEAERELYRELQAEEEEHIALLESERAKLLRQVAGHA